jgi:hypothetical protein
MRPELHLHPDRLRAHAAAAHELSDVLARSVRGPDLPAHAEIERISTSVRRAVRELAELSAALHAAARAAEAADDEAERSLRRAWDRP